MRLKLKKNWFNHFSQHNTRKSWVEITVTLHLIFTTYSLLLDCKCLCNISVRIILHSFYSFLNLFQLRKFILPTKCRIIDARWCYAAQPRLRGDIFTKDIDEAVTAGRENGSKRDRPLIKTNTFGRKRPGSWENFDVPSRGKPSKKMTRRLSERKRLEGTT